MAQIVVSGDTSGSITLSAPAVAGSTVLTLPAVSGTVITTATGQTLTSPIISGTPSGVGVLTSGTAVASTSGTSIDFTGIPSWAKRITVMLNGVSTNGTSIIQVQLGDSGGIENTGYLGSNGQFVAAIVSNTTTGFGIGTSSGSTGGFNGALYISLLNSASNIWVCTGNIGDSTNNLIQFVAGSKSLSATLDRIRLTTVNGTDTFDAGSINIMYE